MRLRTHFIDVARCGKFTYFFFCLFQPCLVWLLMFAVCIFFSRLLLLLFFYWRIGKIYCCWSAPMTLIHTAFGVSSDTLCAKYDDNNSVTSRLKRATTTTKLHRIKAKIKFYGVIHSFAVNPFVSLHSMCVCFFSSFFSSYFSLIPNDTI